MVLFAPTEAFLICAYLSAVQKSSWVCLAILLFHTIPNCFFSMHVDKCRAGMSPGAIGIWRRREDASRNCKGETHTPMPPHFLSVEQAECSDKIRGVSVKNVGSGRQQLGYKGRWLRRITGFSLGLLGACIWYSQQLGRWKFSDAPGGQGVLLSRASDNLTSSTALDEQAPKRMIAEFMPRGMIDGQVRLPGNHVESERMSI